jgi:hypothetical protein
MYKMYREDWFEVVYHSGRIVTYTQLNLPRTVEKFIDMATSRKEVCTEIFNRTVIIYTP